MRYPGSRRRTLRIGWYFVRLVAHIAWWDVFLARTALFGWVAAPTRTARYRRLARRFRTLALDLGGVMIKLGQFASSRVDLLPPEVIAELVGLQDEVPPVPFAEIAATIAAELGQAPELHFAAFSSVPVAAASFGQVHFATLHDGREVAVKVQRPHIERLIETDLAALGWVVSWLKFYPPIRRRADLPALLAEFARVTRQELDYRAEARSMDLFRSLIRDDEAIVIPLPYHALSTGRVLVMERVSGLKITDYAALDAAGVDRGALSELLYHFYLRQVFVEGIFHADPHPGNLFVRLTDSGWELVILDFGMIGTVSKRMMLGLGEGALGVLLNDPQRILTGLQRTGMLLPGADERQLLQGTQVVLRYTHGRTLSEISKIDMLAVAEETRDLLYSLPFQLPQDMIFLGRAIGVVGGICTGLAPDLNIFESAQGVLRQIFRDQLGSQRSLRQRIADEGREALALLVRLPRLLDAFYSQATRGELYVQADVQRLERRLDRLERRLARLGGGLVATGLFLGAVLLEISSRDATWVWAGAAAVTLWSLWPRK